MNLLLIDLSSIVHAQFHVSGSDPNPDATSIASLARVHALASGQPHVGICVEGGRSFRKDIDPTYKANRPETNAALVHQMGIVIDTLRADGFPIWRCEGCEADDVIASAVTQAMMFGEPATVLNNGPSVPLVGPSETTGLTVTIATSDKDLLQLVSDRVSVKSLKDGTLIDPAAVKAKLGVDPEQVRDWLTLVGDASDNIKGCEKVGAKTATELLRKYGTLEDIMARPMTDFTDKLGQNLRTFGTPVDGESPAMRARALVTMKTDLPVPIAEAFTERKAVDIATFDGGNDGEDMGSDTARGDERDGASLAGNGGGNGAGDTGAGTDHHCAEPSGTQKQDARSLDGSHQRASAPTADIGHARQSQGLTALSPPIEWERQLEPQSYSEAKALAADMFAAKLFNGYGSPAAVLSTILMGREIGLQAGASLRGFHIVESKHLMHADLIRARVMASPLCEYFRCTERTPSQATFATKRKGDPEMMLTFTLAEGRLAWSGSDDGFKKSGWGKNPADMCVARASSKLARLVYPEVVHGFYAPEEMG